MDDATFVKSQLSFRVADVNASVKFYTEVLNFKSYYYSETPWEHAIIKRDEVVIHLNKTQLADEWTVKGCAFILVNEIENLWQKVKTNEGILSDLGETNYYPHLNVKEFILRDIDGNVLRFSEEVSE